MSRSERRSKKVTPSTESTRAPRASDASTTEVLDFYALSNYGEARDDNFRVVAETVRNADSPGTTGLGRQEAERESLCLSRIDRMIGQPI